MPIGPFAFFRIYQGIHLHFTSKYDVFKYQFKSPTINKDTFDDRKDRGRFDYWAGKYQTPNEALESSTFNFLRSSDWLYKSFDESRDWYLEKKKFYSSFTKNIKADHDYIRQLRQDKALSFSEIIQPTRRGNKPPLLQIYLQGHVSIEFMCLLNSSHNFCSEWKSHFANDPLVTEEINKIEKYTPFVIKFSGYGQKNSSETS